LKVGYHTWSFSSLSLEKALKHIRDAGFTEVEINANMAHLDPRICKRQELPQIRNLLKDLSLHPNSVHMPIDGADISTSNLEERRQAIKLLTDTLEYCRAIECPIAVMHPSHFNSLYLGVEVMKKNSMEALREIVPKAEDLGVKIALENMIEREKRRFGSRIYDLVKIIEDIGSPYVGICLDTGHTNLLPDPNISLKDEIIQAGERLWTLHVHDNDGVEDRHWPPGDGSINWSQVVTGLRKVNYQGVFMMEVQERGNPDELASKCLQKATDILNTY